MNVGQQSARLRPFRPVPFGRYTLLSPLSVGGMGEIFLARLDGAKGFEKLCVIKKILPSLASDPEFVERFVNEAKILVKLSHGSIAQVLDVGLYEGDPYIALEHVDGKDLRRIAGRARDRNLPLPLTFVLYVMTRVLDALAYAHRKRDDDEKELGLVHRDVSPQNILVSYEGEVKVIDFGLAKSSLSSARTNPSMILGKFMYMSPEQARHQKVDRRSDLYSAGLCLYELVSGRNPFDDIPPHELMARVANPVVAPLHTIDPLCPPAVQEMVARALEIDPARRFQTAEEFRGKVMAALVEIDTAAGPESVSKYMRETFQADYQQERRLLASLKGLARPPVEGAAPQQEKKRNERETAVFALRDVAPNHEAARGMSIAPTVAPVNRGVDETPVVAAPLSFAPTPRARETTDEVRADGATMPGVVITEELRRATIPHELDMPWSDVEVTDNADTVPPDTLVVDDSLFEPRVRPLEDTQPRVVIGEEGPAPPRRRADTEPRVIIGTLLEDAPQLPPPQSRVKPARPAGIPTSVDLAAQDATDAFVEVTTDESGLTDNEPTGALRQQEAPRRSLWVSALKWTVAVAAGAALASGGFWAWQRYGSQLLGLVESSLGTSAPREVALGAATPIAPPASEPVAAMGDAGEALQLAGAQADAGVELADADATVEPLMAEPAALVDIDKPPVVTRASAARKERASPELRRLRDEWSEVKRLHRKLTRRRYSCEVAPMKMLCFKVEELDAQITELEDEPRRIAQVRSRARAIHQELRQLSRR